MWVVVVAVNTMSPHKCSDKCPSTAKNGPKINCLACKNVCFLHCFGFEAGAKIDGLETVKITIGNEIVFTTFVATMAFSCCTNSLSAKDHRAALKMPSVARNASQTRASKSNDNEQLLANKLNCIEDMLQSIKSATESNTAEIAAIKSLSTQTDANMKKVSEQNVRQLSTPKGPAMQYVMNYRSNSYAAAAAQNAAGCTPSSKRKREHIYESQKPKFPEPKVGTKANVNGLKIVPKVIRVRDEKPLFAKALYASGFGTDTENVDIAKYIVEETPVTDATKFKVHKMVKKDADLSQLKFVSFKVELNVDELEILNNADLWPQGVRVREFTVLPKNQLGNYFPEIPAKKPANNATTPVEIIDLENEQATGGEKMDATVSTS